MSAASFIENFEHLANAPGGTDQIRQLVMATALMGRLTPPNASLPENIENILVENRSAYLAKIGKKEKPLLFGDPLISEFSVPEGWTWKRVGELCDLQTGATPSRSQPEYFGGEIRWLVSGDINLWDIFECEGRITQAGLDNSNCKIIPPNSVLIALNGQGKTRASVALLHVPAACNQSLVAMIPFAKGMLSPIYLRLALKYRYFEIRDITGQNQRRGLNMGLISELSIPLPSLEEQKRIVAKVDELMILCDKLEAQQQERERRFPLLSRTTQDRFAKLPKSQNLRSIFSYNNQISPAELRKTILALALTGKLSFPNMSLPSDVNEAIVASRSAYFTSVGKRQKPLLFGAPLIEEFQIPSGWKWRRVGELCALQTGATPSRQKPEYFGGNIRWLVSGDINLGEIFDCKGRITQEGIENSNCKILPPNSVMIALNGQGKTRATVAILRVPAACNQSLVAMIPFSKDLIDPEYLLICLRYRYSEIRGITGQNQRRGLNMGMISELSIPMAPLDEQKNIVARVHKLMALCDRLEGQQTRKDEIASAYAKAVVGSITGVKSQEAEPMKTPNTELISNLKAAKKPKAGCEAALATILQNHKGELPAKALWQQSRLEIDAFYQQLRTEIAAGWIAEPKGEDAYMKELATK